MSAAHLLIALQRHLAASHWESLPNYYGEAVDADFTLALAWQSTAQLQERAEEISNQVKMLIKSTKARGIRRITTCDGAVSQSANVYIFLRH